MTKGNVSTRIFNASIVFFVLAIAFGASFIATSMSSRVFSWKINACLVSSGAVPEVDEEDKIYYKLDVEADIGWREFTVTYNDSAVQNLCFATIEPGGVYSLGDFQNNSGSAAGLGMAASWAVAIIVAIWAGVAMCCWLGGQTTGVFLVTVLKLAAFFCLGIIVSTTVFWWLIEGKFGDRREALAPRLFELVTEAAEKCSEGTNIQNECNNADWEMDSPGWALSLGITSIFMYATAVFLLWLQADRADALTRDGDDSDASGPVKPVTGDFVVEKQVVQAEDKTRGKDRRSAKTGVRSGARAPTATVQGGAAADMGPDPMTYALEQGGDEGLESQDDDDDEVVYQNHQVHHNVINHSTPNRTQHVDDHIARRQQDYGRGYSRGTSGSYGGRSFEDRGVGGRSFDERSEAEFSETASSAQYYAQHQGQSFMSASSQGGSFDEYH